MANSASIVNSIPLPNENIHKGAYESGKSYPRSKFNILDLFNPANLFTRGVIAIDDLILLGLIILILTEEEKDYFLLIILGVLFFAGL